ncbi:pre-mRNA-splicing factor ATP-dependent RNA helicase dhx15 [Plakobranchus ocellatus]|uniref:Pre-mRNA-splicing factor ATP-dependent RNA helicase dhx15 n=1 Tax=Plakobranchus ocellatus TaxID=259542 RepID=A0AAV4AFM1_9GAST|nr:pre-mRNA-splicing factor ATP-dependent RNA helicase dhx15 [Plakobranchus ocellatus]
MMDYIYATLFLDGPPSRRSRPRSLCARCGGIAQDETLLSTRPRSSDRGPCNLSIEVDGREGRQGRRRHSSTGRDSNGRGNNPLYCYVVSTDNGQKAAGSATTYRESFRSPPPEELRSRKIRSLPSSPITESVSSSRAQRKASARQKSAHSNSKVDPVDDDSPPLIKQTDCSPSLISLLNNENSQEVSRPAKGRGDSTAAAKGKTHQPLWTEAGDAPLPAPSKRRSAKGLAHQPLWSDKNDEPVAVPALRRSAKGLTHQPLWSDGSDAPPPAPTPRRSAKGLSHQPLWTADAPDAAPVRVSRRAASRSVSESEAAPAAGIKTQPQPNMSNNLMTWVS